jgi:hypothetical protein
MLKSLVDIDVRKVATVCGIAIAFAVPISKDAIPGVPLDTLMPAAAVIYVKGIAGLVAWACGIIVSAHNIGSLMSPKAPQ